MNIGPIRHRGFALLIVMAIAGATMVVAISLSRLAGSTAQVSAKEEQSLMAANAARTGLERASAYAAQIAAATGGDFDLVLDPSDEADCTGMSGAPFDFTQVDGTNTILRPRFSDGTHVQWPAGSGKWWRVVPYLGGAYLVRFEDDGDDDCAVTVANTLSAWTSNHVGSGTCYEGVGATTDSPPGYDSAVNPVRDMNRAIWVISLGIFPGTDPAAARYRVTERRMVSDNSVSADAAFFADEFHAHSSSSVIFESDEAVMATNNNHVNASGSWQMCRSESANWDIGSGSTSAAAACGSLTYGEITTGAITVPTVPAWNDKTWMDFNSQCNFLIRNLNGSDGGDPEGLWWWNRAGVWGPLNGNQCNDPTDFATIPAPLSNPAIESPLLPSSCWVPLMVSPEGTGGMFDPCELQQTKDGAGAAFLPAFPPTPGPAYVSAGATGGANPARFYPDGPRTAPDASCNSYYVPALAAAPAVPDFDATCGLGVNLPGRGVVGTCAGCDGTQWAIHYEHPPGTAQFTFRPTLAGTHYIPAGLYIYLGLWDIPASASADAASNWDGVEPPMITLIMSDTLTLPSATGYGFGSGGSPNGMPTGVLPAYPGLVVPTDLSIDNTATLEVWGGTYIDGDVDTGNTSRITLRGPVVITGQVTTSSNSDFVWRYPDTFFPVSVTPGTTGARLSYPIRF